MSNVSSSNGLGKYPKLRFKGFSEPWAVMRLSDFTTRIMRKNTTNATDIPLTISSKDGLINQNDFFNKQVASKDMSGYYLLHRGEYAYNKSYSVGYDFGSIKRLEKYDMGALSTLYICFALTKFNTDFIKHYFDSLKWYREIYMISAEGARNHGLLNVPTEDFFATLHTLPTDEAEQAKIASFLDALTARIEKQRSLVENLKKYKRGVSNVIFAEAEHWEKAAFLDVFCTVSDKPYQVSTSEYCECGTYEVVDQGKNDIVGYNDDENKVFHAVPIIVYGDHTTIIKYRNTPFIVGGDGVKLLASHTPNNLQYLYYALCQYNIQPEGYKRHFSIVKNIFIPLPSLEQQMSIAKILATIDLKIQKESALLEQLLIQKKALLQQFFI